MIGEDAVIRFLHDAPSLSIPDEVLARLQETIAGEVELRQASRIDPDVELPEIKQASPVWSDDTVTDA